MHRLLEQNTKCEVVSLISDKNKPYCNGKYKVWLKERVAGLTCIFPTWAEKRFGNQITRWENFRKWNKIIPSQTFFECKMIPEEIGKEFDYFIAGSDQIWNYHFSSDQFNDFFLKFAEKEKRIAISASFGIEELPKEWYKEYRDSLNGFSSISVREEAGAAIIKKLLGTEVPVLIDPTMMLTKEEWLNVSRKPRVECSKSYILKYYLGDEEESEKIDVWAKENGYEVYELLNKDIPELYSAGPGEFISLISNASLICSDSFHCIVFAIIFSKPFIVYERQGKENYMASRLDTLLKKFGFQNRWKHLLTQDEYLKCDYSAVPDLLKKEQEKFTEYLSEAIK